MATAAYYSWIRDGSPWRTARPVDDLAATLRQRGYTVGTIGNSAHLTANPPEDHTPFSATGWPGQSPYPRVLALDIMPPPAGSGLPDLVTLAERIIAARDAGRPEAAWIKYINWTDRQGRCWHTSWQPSRAQWSSTDTGHIHISGRTDYVDSACAAGWDPSEGDDMSAESDSILEAWSWGVPTIPGPDGKPRPHCPVQWEIQREAWQAALDKRIDALTAAIQALASGGTSIDTTAVIAHIDQVAATESQTVAALQAQVADLTAKLRAAGAAVAGTSPAS